MQEVLLADGRRISRQEAMDMQKHIEADIAKSLEVKEEVETTETELEELQKMKKVDLLVMAKEAGIEVKGMSKDEIALALLAKEDEELL
jgi:ribosomal protein L17